MSFSKDFNNYLVTVPTMSPADSESRFLAMHMKEIAERTRLLRNLQYDRKEIKKRIKQNLRWEFESPLELPSFYNQIEKIIDNIYENKSPKAG